MAKKKQTKNKGYSSKLSAIYLKQQNTPKSYETAGVEWVNYGDGQDYKNLYPNFLIDLYDNSATHRAIVDAASAMIAGKGVLIEDDTNTEAVSKLNILLKNINSRETIEGLLSKIAKDLYLHGAFALNIIYTRDKQSISSVNHIPCEKIRAGVPNNNGIVDKYYVSSDWSNYRKKECYPVPVPAFNPNDRSDTNQILYVTDYTPGLEIYGAPSYSASTNWILTDSLVSEYHLNNIQTGFSPTTWINFNDGQPTEEEQRMIERAIERKMTGVGGKKMVLTFTDEGTNVPDIQNLSLSDAHEQYQTLNELIIQNLMIGHRVVSPSLMGVKTAGQLGGKNELLDAYELYSRSVIQPYQDIIVKALSKVFSIAGINIPFSIKDVAPFANKFGIDTLKEVLTRDELRAELGLEPLEASEEVIEDEAKVNMSKRLKTEDIEKLIEGFGENEEELLKDYELISTEDANDEDEDEDYEASLNKDRLDLADVKTGKGYPNRKSKQDGRNKSGDLFRVRYVYTGNPNPERPFCKAMMRANKVYRKEDIKSMSRMAVNPGWGAGGKNTYSIWLHDCSNGLKTNDLQKFYKGGGNCKHKWFRKIYLQKGNRAINDDEVLTTTEARSRGFKPEVNEKEVPVAPNDMPNKGFLNK
tara:strand:+ start:3640 stop:5562 length:1923 start_codon:yes stop_codon:yes gene_type:complete